MPSYNRTIRKKGMDLSLSHFNAPQHLSQGIFVLILLCSKNFALFIIVFSGFHNRNRNLFLHRSQLKFSGMSSLSKTSTYYLIQTFLSGLKPQVSSIHKFWCSFRKLHQFSLISNPVISPPPILLFIVSCWYMIYFMRNFSDPASMKTDLLQFFTMVILFEGFTR